MPPKSKKGMPWSECDKCGISLLSKDIEHHVNDCPPSTRGLYYYINNGVLNGLLDVKSNEDIKGISLNDRDNMVFLSQSAIQLCDLSIGQWAVVSDIDKKYPSIARIVWPTIEKNLTSVLLTKAGLDAFPPRINTTVIVSKLTLPIQDAQQIKLVALTNLKMIELSSELNMRICKTFINRLLTAGNVISIHFFGKVLKFEVKHIEHIKREFTKNADLQDDFSQLSLHDEQFYKVVDKTKWLLFRSDTDYGTELKATDLILQIGGLDREIAEIQEIMNVALKKMVEILKLKASRGILVYGASGTGKTLVVNAIARNNNSNVVRISLTDLYGKSGESPEEMVKKLLDDAVAHAPSIILLDEMDLLCPLRTTRLSDSEKRIIANVMNFFDEIIDKQHYPIFLLATTNKPDNIDPAFRRCGRLDREIEIPTPNPQARHEILQQILKNSQETLETNDLKAVANCTHGFVGSDLVLLCSTASMHAIKQNKTNLKLEDFKYALTRVRPSAMREVQIEVPNVRWADIGGQENLKLILRQSVEWPLKHPQSFIRMGITPPRGVLMFGPPGCSKTMIAKALATESGLNFLSIKGPELFSKWVGESERAVREVFRKARQVAPSVIFFDEIDALGGERSSGSGTSVQERVLAQLLTELDGVTPLGDVTVVAATNRPDRIDKALLRPGRLDRIVHVPLPDANTRKEIFNLKLAKMPVVDVNVDELVALTDGYSGAEVNATCHEAAMKALEEDLDAQTINMQHFLVALKLITPRTSPSLLKIYEEYTKQ